MGRRDTEDSRRAQRVPDIEINDGGEASYIHGTKLISVLLYVQLLSTAAIFLAAALWKLCRTSRIEEITPEWLDNFPVSAYQPIEGLLAREDWHLYRVSLDLIL